MANNFNNIEDMTQYGTEEYMCPASSELITPVNDQAKALMGGEGGNSQEAPVISGSYITHDISQSHHFRINIDKIPVEFNSKVFGNFLPVKSISFDEITFENLTIPVGIFGDFPIMQKRRLGRFSLSLYDPAGDEIEKSLQIWENLCFPQGKYVNYLSEIVGKMKYASYSVDGTLNSELSFYVLPTDSHRISRGYEENALKLIQFSLVVVGVVGAKTGGNVPSKGEVLLSGDNRTPINNEESIKNINIGKYAV